MTGVLRGALARGLRPLIERIVDERLAAELPAAEARAAQAAYERGRAAALTEPLVFGDASRLRIDPTAIVNDALLNTESGTITVERHAFCGHRVSLLTGAHDVGRRGRARQLAIPREGRDIRIGAGAWIGSGAIVLGPCTIGADAVVAAGAVVTGDVAPATLVAGVPARLVRAFADDD